MAESNDGDEQPTSIPDKLLFGDDAETGHASGGAEPGGRDATALTRQRRKILALALVPSVVVAGAAVWGLASLGGPSSSPASTGTDTGSGVTFTAAAAANQDAATAEFEKLQCPRAGSVAATDYGSANSYLATCGPGGSAYLLGPSVLSGADVKSAVPATGVPASTSPAGSVADGYGIDITLNAAGAKALASISGRLHREEQSAEGAGMLAIVVNGVAISAPVMHGSITSGHLMASGPALTQVDVTTYAAEMTREPSALLFRPVLQFH